MLVENQIRSNTHQYSVPLKKKKSGYLKKLETITLKIFYFILLLS